MITSCQEQVDLSKETNIKSIENIQGTWGIHCEGKCSDNCTINQVVDKVWECTCDECYMVYTRINPNGSEEIHPEDENLINSLLNEYGTQLSHLENHILETFGSSSYVISGITLVIDDEKISYFYDFEVNGLNESVAFIISLSVNGSKVKVSCDGTCEDVLETCRERYVFLNSAIECTCQGDCDMTIEELEEPGLD